MLTAKTSRSLAALSLGLSLVLTPRLTMAAPPAAREAPSTVELVFVDLPESDPLVATRIRTLFPASTAVLSRRSSAVDAASILQASSPDTLRVWIRFRDANQVRIYMAASDDGAARYLFRDVSLDHGLDEVGGESLAQVVHSAAEALWSGEQQMTHAVAARTLSTELAPSPPSHGEFAPPSPSPREVSSARTPPPLKDELGEARTVPPASKSAFFLGMGATFGVHLGAAEGALYEPGACLVAHWGKLSLRLDGAMVWPADVELPPVNVHVTGVVGAVKLGLQTFGTDSLRLRVELGVGAWGGRFRTSVVSERPAAQVSPAQDFVRPFAAGSLGLEWFHGPLWLAARVELRGRLNRAEYTIAGQSGSITGSYAEPGGVLEMGAVLGKEER
jgi:hypothetical protein